MATMPALEPERMIEIKTTIKAVPAINRSILHVFTYQYNPTGKPIASTAAKPAGLSKLPVTAKLE